jgi:hypothetical protein
MDSLKTPETSFVMKSTRILSAALLLAAATPLIHAQTLNWGSPVGTLLVDSNGDGIDDRYVFELGAFNLEFTPDENNLEEWVLNWMVFDTASYNPDFGYFTSSVHVLSNVTSSNPGASPDSFAGLTAYLWIRDSDEPVEGSEWLLVRADNWTFPLTGGDCCDTGVIEWSVSDLETGNTPLYGRQGGTGGPGEFTHTSSGGLQTHTFVPEPSAAILGVIAFAATLLRRRRTS